MTPPLTPREKVARAIQAHDNDHVPDGYANGLSDEVSDWSAYLADRVLAALASGSGDHAELARLAEAATPGPWEATGTTVWREEAVPIPVTVCCGNGLPSGECCGNGVEDCEWDRTQGEIANAGSNDAAFIAAASPATVLALLAENAALRSKSGLADMLGEKLERRTFALDEAERKLAEAVELLIELADAPQPKDTGGRFFRAMSSINAYVARLNASKLSKEGERG